MAIEVGDAVLRFLGDTTQLDVAFDKVSADATTKLQPAKASVNELNYYFGKTGESAGLSAKEISYYFGDVVPPALQSTARASREATGAIALLGEEVGVRMPRHVRSFVAELPGVGATLEAAFSAIALIALVEVIVDGTKRLSEFIANTFIYTDAMKEAETRTKALNAVLVPLVKQYEDAKKAVEDFGKSQAELAEGALAKITLELQKNREELTKQQAALKALHAETSASPSNWRLAIEAVGAYIGVTIPATEAEKKHAEAIENTNDKITELTAKTKAQSEQEIEARQKADKADLDEFTKFSENLIAIAKTKGDARIALALAEENLKLAGLRVNYLEQASAKSAAEEQEYQLQLSGMNKRLGLLQLEGKSTQNEQDKLHTEIQALELQHQTKLVDRMAEFKRRLYDASHNIPVPLVDVPIPDSVVNDSDIAFQKMADAAHAVGITLSVDLFKAAQDAGYAYVQLKNSSVASIGDILQANIKMVQATIAYKESVQQAHTADDKSLIVLQAQYDALGGKVEKTRKVTRDFFQQFQEDMKHGVHGMEEVKTIGEQAFNSLSAGIQSAIASVILSQQSLGVALEQATAQALASLAAQALVKAIFYTAEGFAALANPFSEYSASEYFAAAGEMALVGGAAAVAGRALSGASSSKTASSGATANDNSPQIQAPAQVPTVSSNVQKFATGGLVTKPTLAMIGDSTKDSGYQEEAAIPLNDPQAVKKIVEALGGGGGPTFHVHVQGLVSPDNLTKVMKQINRKVTKGQGNLVASNSLRLTKRSL